MSNTALSNPSAGSNSETPSGITPLSRGMASSSFWMAILVLAVIWLGVWQAHASPDVATALTATIGVFYQLLRMLKVVGHAQAQSDAINGGLIAGDTVDLSGAIEFLEDADLHKLFNDELNKRQAARMTAKPAEISIASHPNIEELAKRFGTPENASPDASGLTRAVQVVVALIFFAPLFTSCATQINTAQSATKAASNDAASAAMNLRLQQTGEFVMQRAIDVAFQTVLTAAQSAADSDKKSDYLQGLAAGFRSEEGKLLAPADVKTLVQIWTPGTGDSKPAHWLQLGSQLAALYAKANPKTPAEAKIVLEAIAQGLDAAPGDKVP